MATRGRRRKSGKRTKAGQLSRAGQLTRPSEWVQKQLETFGNHYSSALGRAYAKGLLGDLKTDGTLAKTRYDAGRKFVQRYTRVIGGDTYACPLGDNDGGSPSHDPERDAHQQGWLFDVMAELDRSGCRPYLDQLLSSLYTDTGPYWLDALLKGGKDPADQMVLDAAIEALDLIGGTQGETNPAKMVDTPLHLCHGAINR